MPSKSASRTDVVPATCGVPRIVTGAANPLPDWLTHTVTLPSATYTRSAVPSPVTSPSSSRAGRTRCRHQPPASANRGAPVIRTGGPNVP